MSKQINDGGPAFSGLTYISWNGEKNPEGISMRDYFAAAALQGLMASQVDVAVPYPLYSYAIADAMLKAREDKP